METRTNRHKSAKWALVALLVAGAAFAYGTDARAALEANGVVVDGKVCREMERRDFADGWAVRYVLPDGERFVEREETVWTLPLDAKAWYQTYSSCYENPYSSSLVRDISVGTVMSLPVTAKLADGSYCLFTEANVVGYTDSAAKYLGEGRFAVYYVNDAKGFSQSGADVTPWRVTLVAKDLETLATSDIVRRLCPDPSPEVAAKCAAFVKGGRSVWQWLPAGDPKYDEQKEWYDRTKALGFEYYLVDDGWKVWRDGDMDQWACLKKWIDYGKSIGVESFVWVDSKEMRTPEARRAYLRKVKDCGAVGIKIDFVPAPSCAQMKWYEETLADTLEFSLMTDFHGCVKPSGRERTWPHEVAREAIRGHEWHITRYDRVLPPEHDCILPFNRLVQGHADYTPVVFEEKELQGYTWARELAQGVVFSARFLCFGDYPQNYLDNPAAELIKFLPTEYDETRILPGSEIGKCVAVAKRKGREWFVAVENGAEERQITIKLDFLGADDCELLGFADAEDKPDGYRIDRRAVERDGKIELTLRPCGGYCARISPAKGSTFADKDGSCPVSTNVRGHENIEWSTAYAYGLTDGTKDLPRVLLVGDSICNGYQEGVRERLKGKVNVSYWVSSYCATSAAYLPLLTIYLDEAKYDVIHFNNGLHSLETPTDAWAKGFKAALELIRRKQPDAKIVWCTSTPLADETKTAKSRELNAAGAKVVAELGGIATNDLFALCDPLDRATNWSDVYHFHAEAKAKQADQVAAAVLSSAYAGVWRKYEGNPVLGGDKLGTCFDVNVVTNGPAPYTMYFSWRPRKAIALVRSEDAMSWTQEPEICLEANPESGWEDNINRSCTVFKDGVWHMWYTGQAKDGSKIGYATSTDGARFTRVRRDPVLVPEKDYEKLSTMNPYVRWDEGRKVWRMWYAAGETYEPNVLCYAESPDGLNWRKWEGNPMFGHGPRDSWDRDRVGACEVHPLPDGSWAMFYIGYSDIDTARIGCAISKDGVTGWRRLSQNPIVAPDLCTWDSSATYKPSVVRDERNGRWLLWYNGRNGKPEYVGCAIHDGLDLEEPPQCLPDTKLILSEYVQRFNSKDDELYTNAIPNSAAEDFMLANVPRFACPDKDIERTYYFRWWTYRKHLRRGDDGWRVTEFLPKVPWSGADNTIVCPAGHHFREGRWLRDSQYLADNARFWLSDEKADHRWRYSSWLFTGTCWLAETSGIDSLPANLLEDAVRYYRKWEKGDERNLWPGSGKGRMGGDGHGGFLSIDNYEGSEFSLGGSGWKPLMNSAMWSEAKSIAAVARRIGRTELANEFEAKAEDVRRKLMEKCWNGDVGFFTTRSYSGVPGAVRELHGYAPWYFGVPVDAAPDWSQLSDPQGFAATYGLSFPERRAEGFKISYEGHECQWNGPSWPFATSIALTALANDLHAKPSAEGRRAFDFLMCQYAAQQKRTRAYSEDWTVLPWIDENLNPDKPDWISRTLLDRRKAEPRERGKDYNHSTFCDLVISGVVGFVPNGEKGFAVDPLADPAWDYFVLENLRYRGHDVSIRYLRGAGLSVDVDGKTVAKRADIGRLEVSLEKCTVRTGARLWKDAPAMWTAPKTYPIASMDKPDIGVKAIAVEGEPFRGRPTRFFAYWGLPVGASETNRVPGIVLVHGGLGTAYASWVKLWTDRGYAAIAMDNCGGVPESIQALGGTLRHKFSGPNGWGADNFPRVDEPLTDQWTYHAVSTLIRSHSFLRSRPEVDPSRIGVTGISWGGYLAACVAGIDDRFAFAVPVYGCAFLKDHSAWSSTFAKIGEKGARWDALSVEVPKDAVLFWVNVTFDDGIVASTRHWQIAMSGSVQQ